ncbi:ribbon-helix-helix domain-containing protein, partial [Lawsonibacter hominis]|uniref:ribbon-helix-helix domain-containing protein n=1 Tax=Lawsonibacter hominis TaxID=2763053 RepID=UPI0035104E43
MRSIGWGLLSGTHSFERRIDLKESPIKTERKTLHLPEDTVRALNKLAAKNGTDFSKEVRRAIDEYLDLETTAENIDMINGVIRQELSGQL